MATIERSAFDIWWDFVCPFEDFVHEHCKSAHDEFVFQRLPPLDWELYVVSMLTGLMENCGSFTDAAGAYSQHADALQRAFNRFGCPEAAALVPECVRLRQDSDAADVWTDVFEARRDAIEQRTDWSYKAVIRFLVDHDEDYLFSVLPFCRIDDGDTIELTL